MVSRTGLAVGAALVALYLSSRDSDGQEDDSGTGGVDTGFGGGSYGSGSYGR